MGEANTKKTLLDAETMEGIQISGEVYAVTMPASSKYLPISGKTLWKCDKDLHPWSTELVISVGDVVVHRGIAPAHNEVFYESTGFHMGKPLFVIPWKTARTFLKTSVRHLMDSMIVTEETQSVIYTVSAIGATEWLGSYRTEDAAVEDGRTLFPGGFKTRKEYRFYGEVKTHAKDKSAN